MTAETNLGDLFSTAQVSGLSGHHATYVALPKLKCDFRDPRSKTVEDVLITPFFVKALSDTITAYICQIEMNKISTYYGFFGSKAVLERQTQYVAYSIKTCQIKAFELQMGKSSLTEIYRDVFTNDTTQFQPEYFWCCSAHETVNYRLIIKKTSIRFNYHTRKPVSPLLPLEQCDSKTHACQLATASIVWEHTINETGNVKEGKQVQAQRNRNANDNSFTLVSESGQLTVTGKWDLIQLCGYKLFSTNEGICIHFDKTDNKTRISPFRQLANQFIATTSEIGLISYVARELEELTYSLYKKTWLNICQLGQQRLMWMKHWLNNPQHAYIEARMLLNTYKITAHLAGELLAINECEVINTYYLAKKDKCYKSIPINFHKFNKTYSRFILPSTRDIIATDAEIDCQKPIKIFWIAQNNDIYMWNGSILIKTDNINYTTVHIIQELVNISHLHLMAARVADREMQEEEFDTLSDLMEVATKTLLTLTHATGADLVALDTEMLTQAATGTVTMVNTAITSVISILYPFLNWIHKIIISIIVIVSLIVVVIIIVRIQKYRKQRQTNEKLTTLLNVMREQKTSYDK